MRKKKETEIKLEISAEEFAYNFKKEIKPNNFWSVAKNGWDDNFYGKCRKNKFIVLFKPAYIQNSFLPVLKGKIEKRGKDYYITYRIVHRLFYKPKRIDELLRKELKKLCNKEREGAE